MKFSGSILRLFHVQVDLTGGLDEDKNIQSLSLVICQRTETRIPPTDIFYLRPGTERKAAILIEL